MDYVFENDILPDLDHVIKSQGEPIIISKKLLDYEIHDFDYIVRYVEKDDLVDYAKNLQKLSGKHQFFYLEFNKIEINDFDKAHIEMSLNYIRLVPAVTEVEEGGLNSLYLIFNIEEDIPSITYTRVSVS